MDRFLEERDPRKQFLATGGGQGSPAKANPGTITSTQRDIEEMSKHMEEHQGMSCPLSSSDTGNLIGWPAKYNLPKGRNPVVAARSFQ